MILFLLNLDWMMELLELLLVRFFYRLPFGCNGTWPCSVWMVNSCSYSASQAAWSGVSYSAMGFSAAAALSVALGHFQLIKFCTKPPTSLPACAHNWKELQQKMFRSNSDGIWENVSAVCRLRCLSALYVKVYHVIIWSVLSIDFDIINVFFENDLCDVLTKFYTN